MNDRRLPTRNATATPALVAALALAMIALAVAGSQPALAGARIGESRSSIAETDTARLVAVAVAAARTLLGADQGPQALVHSTPFFVSASVAAPTESLPDRAIPIHRPFLRAGLIDLPPPAC
jgi:hypothetical protein